MFRFRLSKLLKLRRRAEEEASRALAAALAEAEACRREIERDEANRLGLLTRRDRLMLGPLRTDNVSRNRYQILVLERALEARRRRLGELEAEVQRRRETLVERSRERKLLEKLAERRREDYEEEERRRENRERDSRPLPRHGMSIAMRGPDPDRG
jgi:flagellar FliJ protein